MLPPASFFLNCYNIGLVYAYADNKHFKSVAVAIRRVLKAAGLDYMADSVKLHRATLKMSPALMAKKQIIQLGIKFLDKETVSNNRFLVKIGPDDHLKPFWSTFLHEFNGLPLSSRKFIINKLDVLDKEKMNAIKGHLKGYFIKLYNPDGPMSKTAIGRFFTNSAYSLEKIRKRKNDYEQRAAVLENVDRKRTIEKSRKSLLTPRQRRKKNSSALLTPMLVRQVRRAFAPTQPTGPPAKMVKRDSLSTPRKRPRPAGVFIKRPRLDEPTAGNSTIAHAM